MDNNWELKQITRDVNYTKVGKPQIYKVEARLYKLQRTLRNEPPVSSYLYTDKIPIEYKVFSPKIRKSVNERYSQLYASIAKAYHCRLIWTQLYEPLANSKGLMKTFIIWGPQEMLPFVNDACRLIHDNIHRFNIEEVKRLNKINKSKRALARKTGADNNNTSTIEQMKNHHKYFIDPLLRDLYNEFDNLDYFDSYETLNYRVEQHIINRANLHWKLWALATSKKYLFNATARKNKFHKNRLIPW